MKAGVVKDSRSLMKRIRDYLSKLDAEIGVEKAYLFGSTAKGTRQRNSDVDLIIVSKAFIEMPVPNVEPLARLPVPVLGGSVAGSSAAHPLYVMEVKPVKLDGLGGVGD